MWTEIEEKATEVGMTDEEIQEATSGKKKFVEVNEDDIQSFDEARQEADSYVDVDLSGFDDDNFFCRTTCNQFFLVEGEEDGKVTVLSLIHI